MSYLDYEEEMVSAIFEKIKECDTSNVDAMEKAISLGIKKFFHDKEAFFINFDDIESSLDYTEHGFDLSDEDKKKILKATVDNSDWTGQGVSYASLSDNIASFIKKTS